MAAESFSFPGSTNLASGSYDDETQELEITFRSGATYAYRNVPQGIVEGLKAAAIGLGVVIAGIALGAITLTALVLSALCDIP